ncbi:MAG TPA: ABC transporter substrate-binding protein [Chloroflexota bacterium]
MEPEKSAHRRARARRPLAWVVTAGGLAVASLALLTHCVLSPAPAPRLPRVGVLGPSGPEGAAYLAALRHGLHDQGYVDGQTIAIEEPPAVGTDLSLATGATSLVDAQVDVIVSIGAAAAQAAKAATTRTPIVAVGITSDPVALGLVASLSRPGGNLTGFLVDLPELGSKQLELLAEAFPGTERVAVLWNPDHPTHPLVLRQLDVTARALGVTLQLVAVRGPDDVEPAFTAAAAARADAVLALHDPVTFAQRERIVALAARYRLPAMYEFREWVDGGGLFSYGPSLPEAYQRAALYVDRILRGARPEDLPVEQPTRFELVVNLRATRELGFPMSRAVLDDATDVVQ